MSQQYTPSHLWKQLDMKIDSDTGFFQTLLSRLTMFNINVWNSTISCKSRTISTSAPSCRTWVSLQIAVAMHHLRVSLMNIFENLSDSAWKRLAHDYETGWILIEKKLLSELPPPFQELAGRGTTNVHACAAGWPAELMSDIQGRKSSPISARDPH